MKQLVISLLLILFSATVASAYPVGDLNEDWSVNFGDLKLFTEYWLEEPDCFNAPGCADLIGDDRVDLQDLALLGENWFLSVTPTLVINEFMASNDTALEDPDDAGDFPDWIEIYNYGTETISMAGMMLNDSTDEFIIGAGVTIGAGEHLVFYADKDDDAVPYQGPTHTNFKLDASGDEIYLFNTNGLQIDSKIYNDDQLTDYSYGRYDDATDNWYAMDDPTPGTSNTAGTAGKVWFSRFSGTFINNFSLDLSKESTTGEIRYTTDGSLPTQSSNLYSSPINIDKSTARRIRARVFDTTLAPGPIQSHYYIPLASDLQNFSSNLPIVIVDSYGEDIDNNGTQNDCWYFEYPLQPIATVFIDTDKDSGLASTTDVPALAGRAGTRIRGESSRCWPKRQYSLELWDEYDSDAKSSLLGLPSESDWVLHAPYSDKTQLRNVLSYKWFNDIGQYAPRTRLVEVFFNQSIGNTSYADYRGIYVLMEKIKVSENRVDIAKLDTTDTMEPDITGGYILRIDKDNGQEQFTTTANMIGIFQYYDPDEFDLTHNQKTYIRGWLDEFETVLNSSDFNDPINGYAKYIDVDDFIKYDLLLEIQKNADGLRLSTYMNKDRNGKLAMGPMWDCNLTYGNAYYYPGLGIEWYHRADSVYEGWFNDDSTFGAKYAWYDRMMQDSDYKMRYADMWFSLRETVISDESMLADIDYYYDLLDSDGPSVNTSSTPVDRNYVKWPVLGTSLWPNFYVGYTYDNEILWLKTWITGDGTTDSKSTYTNRLQWVDELWESDRNVSTPPILKIDGSAMNTGGNIEVGSTLTMTGSSGTIYYTTDGTDPREWTHWDSGEGTVPFTSTLVSEGASKKVLVPTGPVSDNWKGGDSFNDSGWTATSGGVGYAADGDWYEPYINYDVEDLMRGDDKNETCYIRTPFSITAGDHSNMEYLKLGIRYDDAFVAYINGTEVARSDLVPTPLEWNSGSTGPVSESTALIEFDITAYKDVLNPENENILAIHGLNRFLTSSDFLMSFELKAGAIGSGTGLITGGAVSANAMAYSGGITLNGSEQIKARVKNGGNWSALNEAVFSDSRVADSLRITEVMYQPADPNDEFIEFKNVGPSTINLQHCQLTKGVDFTFPDMTLAPGAYTVIARNQAHFIATHSYSGSIAGEFINDKLDNGGENIRLKDAVGAIIQEFDYEDGWFPVTDGMGYSINIIDPTDTTLDNWNKRLSWQASNVAGGTPGASHTANPVGNEDIVINEILTHTDDVEGDWIEIYNASTGSINIGNWYLSDDKDNLKKYRIAPTTLIPANGYVVFTATSHFQNGANPGSSVTFGLSEHGEDVFLTSGDGSDIAGGYSTSESFGSSSRDVTFGRYEKSALEDYNIDFIELDSVTQGAANDTAYVPDVVITEIMYNAQDIQDQLGEYIELYNRTGSTVYLYDLANPDNTWQFTKGINFTFPTGVSIPAYGRILISRALPAAFKTANGISGTVYGPFEDGTELENDGEKIELSMPTDPDPGTGFISYIRVEQVNYSDGIHPLGNDPWPTGADARGNSLHRDSVSSYSNDVDNWSTAPPTPGS